jgi:DnaD/phage-associated family protein
MAKYRQLYTEFWSDSFVLELTPEEKYFYLYLISNSKTTQCGVYEISKRTIETDTGYNRETVEKLIQRFCDYKKILYCNDTKELMIINWIKYNVPNNSNSIKCVNKEIHKIKNKSFVKTLFNKCKAAGLDIEKIFENLFMEEAFYSDASNSRASVEVEETQKLSKVLINKHLSRGMQGDYKPLGSNRIRSNEEEVIIKKQKPINKEEEEEVIMHKSNSELYHEGLKDVIKIFEENIHPITPLEYEKILEFTKHVSYEVIIMAIEEAVNYNAKTIKYITEILSSWMSHGIKTGDEVKIHQKKWASKRKSNINPNVKKGGFCDYEQRTYDFDDLEKRLLGHMDTEDIEYPR